MQWIGRNSGQHQEKSGNFGFHLRKGGQPGHPMRIFIQFLWQYRLWISFLNNIPVWTWWWVARAMVSVHRAFSRRGYGCRPVLKAVVDDRNNGGNGWTLKAHVRPLLRSIKIYMFHLCFEERYSLHELTGITDVDADERTNESVELASRLNIGLIETDLS